MGISFCVKSELLLMGVSDTSVSFSDTKMNIFVSFQTDFSNIEISDITVIKDDASKVEQTIQTDVFTCVCNKQHACVDNPMLHQNSIFIICVKPLNENVKVTKFDEVALYQDGVMKFNPVLNGETQQLTTVSVGSVGVIETRLFSSFFKMNKPSMLFISGVVRLDFKAIRALNENGYRKVLIDESNRSTFMLNVNLAQTNDIAWDKNVAVGFVIVIVGFTIFLWMKKRSGFKSDYSLISIVVGN